MTFEQAKKHLLSDGKIRQSVLVTLSGLTRAESVDIADIWPHIPAERREQIARSLVELAEDSVEMDFAVLFRLALTDPDPEVRRAGVEGLWEDDSPDLIGAFEHLMLDDPDEDVRAQAAIALGRYSDEAELGELDESVAGHIKTSLLQVMHREGESLEVKRRALEAVSFFEGDEAVTSAIDAAYKSPVEKMRASAIFAMGRNLDQRWLPTVVRELKSEEPELRYEAARASGEYGDAKAVPSLEPLLSDDREIALQAIWALGQIGGDRAKRLLRQCIESGDEEMSEAADEALVDAEFFGGDTDNLFT